MKHRLTARSRGGVQPLGNGGSRDVRRENLDGDQVQQQVARTLQRTPALGWTVVLVPLGHVCVTALTVCLCPCLVPSGGSKVTARGETDNEEQKRLLPALHHVPARPSHSRAPQMKRAPANGGEAPAPPPQGHLPVLLSPPHWPYSVSPPTLHLLSCISDIRREELSREGGGRGSELEASQRGPGGNDERDAMGAGRAFCPPTLELRFPGVAASRLHRLGVPALLGHKSTVLFSIFHQNSFSRHQ